MPRPPLSASRASWLTTAWHGDAEHGVDHGLLGQQAKPDGDAEQDRKAHALPLHQHHPGVELTIQNRISGTSVVISSEE